MFPRGRVRCPAGTKTDGTRIGIREWHMPLLIEDSPVEWHMPLLIEDNSPRPGP